MTDNEIIKALGCCEVSGTCDYCPLKSDKKNCVSILSKNALDLINRQKAEIEKLQEVIFKKEDTVQILHKEHQETVDELQFAKAEIERLQKANGLLKYLKEAVHRVEIGGKEEVVEYASDEAFYDAITKKINLMCNVQTAKDEAYKEFAERLKEKANKTTWISSGELVAKDYTISRKDLDNLLEETESETDNNVGCKTEKGGASE